jgi:predicted dehydrogenase
MTTDPAQNSTLNMAVVGTGYLGRFHAQKYQQLDSCELVAICDVSTARAQEVAAELSTNAISNHLELIGQVDAVSVASPTTTHFAVAQDLLKAGIHVLVEKPMTVTVDEAQTLVDLAKANNCILQVGHLERFNPALLSVADQLTNPIFIESHRLAPFTKRGADVNVVLDLMIHDIDIILHLVQADLVAIHANGAPVVSDEPDIANVRLEFGNGCVANVTASRVSGKVERRMRFFQKDSYIAIDFQENTSRVCKVERNKELNDDGIPPIHCDDASLGKGDAILAEIESFVNAINTNTRPLVSGEDGLRALRTAIEIGTKLSTH